MDALLQRLVNYCTHKNVICAEEADTYRYGFDLLFSSLVHIAVLLAVGVITGRAWHVALILAGYIPLQSFGGGYHAKTHLACLFFMFIEMVCALIVIEFAPSWLLLAGALLSVGIIFMQAPVQHPNAPFSPAFALRMKRITRLLSIVICGLMLLLAPMSAALMSCLAMSLILAGFSLLCALQFQNK